MRREEIENFVQVKLSRKLFVTKAAQICLQAMLKNSLLIKDLYLREIRCSIIFVQINKCS
jgi:hypothetical protein